MFGKSKDHAGSHDENRGKVCLICFKKKEKMVTITSGLKNHIQKIASYDSKDNRLPKVVCKACKIVVYRSLKSSEPTSSVKLPDYSKFKLITPNTRSKKGQLCECELCVFVRNPGNFNFVKRKSMAGETDGKMIQRSQFELLKRKADVSSTAQHYETLKLNIISDLTLEKKEHLVCHMIKNISNQKLTIAEQIDESAILALSQERGKPLKIVLNSQQSVTKKRRYVSADDVWKMSTNYGLSTRKMHGIVAAFRVATGNRKLFQPGLKQNLKDLNHSLDSYFDVKECSINTYKKYEATTSVQTLVFCNDVNGLIEAVLEKRGVDNVHLKFGIDGGGGFLKVCLSIQALDGSELENFKDRQKYTEGVVAKKFKDSGVKKLLLLGIVAHTQENYENVSVLWSLLNLKTFKGTIATDLKLANILIGIMPHASSFPCTWCTVSKNELHTCGEYRSIKNCRDNFCSWKNSGSKKTHAKKYKNCTQIPIVSENCKILILEIIPPPELHLILGCVNKMFQHMLEDFYEDSHKWAKMCNVTREFVHGSPAAFAGNSCKTLLEKVDLLRRICSISCLKYVRCLKDFQAVVESCFSSVLKPNYVDCISEFQKSYCDLGISITPKVHAVFFHVPDFCSRSGKGLGFFSEQAMESVHADFKTTWAKYKLSSEHSDYSTRLLKAVREYNAQHV